MKVINDHDLKTSTVTVPGVGGVGQSWVLHDLVWDTWFKTSKGQNPPFSAGLMMKGLKVCVPPPHGLLHSPTGLYSYLQFSAI